MIAMMKTDPAAIPTHASTLLSVLDLCSAAGATTAGATTGGNESVGVSGVSGVWGA
jgi:hypothetical protein